MFSAKPISQHASLNSGAVDADFARAKNTISPHTTVKNHVNLIVISGWVVMVIGLLGLFGYGLDNHFLKSFGLFHEISIQTAFAFVLLGLSLIQGFYSERKTIKSALLFGVLGIGLYNVAQHFIQARFQLHLPLIDPFYEIPMSFLTAIQLSIISSALLLTERYHSKWWATTGLGLVGVWLVITTIFALVGHFIKLPVLFSYIQAFPTIICVSLIGFAVLQQTLYPPGLLSPLTSTLSRVKLLALLSLFSVLMILLAGIITVKLFSSFMLEGVSSFDRDEFLIGFELATIVLSMLVLTLSMRVLFFYETSLQAEANWQQLNLKLEQRVKERTAELETVSMQKSKLLSMVSHDLKTPLAAIGRFAELLGKENATLSEQQRDMIGYISEGIGQMRVMVTDILDRARIEAGKVIVRSERIQVEPFLKKLAETIQPLADEKAVDLQIEIQPELEITADPILLRQILLNLLSNAIKYNKRNGKVWLRACADHDNERAIFGVHDMGMDVPISQSGKSAPGENTLFEIQDTGIGIPTDQIPFLFTEFHRVGAGMNTMEGTGLGLASTKKLVELHGGQIEVSSQEGIGSEFIVKMPIMAETKQGSADKPVVK